MPAGGRVRRGSPGTNRVGGTAVRWPRSLRADMCRIGRLRSLRAGRCRRHNGSNRMEPQMHTDTHGCGSVGSVVSHIGASAWNIVYCIGTIRFGARQVWTGQRCLAGSPVRRRSSWRRPAGRRRAGRTAVAARCAARCLSTAWSAVPADAAMRPTHPALHPQEWLALPRALGAVTFRPWCRRGRC
jgi:hypothetical protein